MKNFVRTHAHGASACYAGIRCFSSFYRYAFRFFLLWLGVIARRSASGGVLSRPVLAFNVMAFLGLSAACHLPEQGILRRFHVTPGNG